MKNKDHVDLSNSSCYMDYSVTRHNLNQEKSISRSEVLFFVLTIYSIYINK